MKFARRIRRRLLRRFAVAFAGATLAIAMAGAPASGMPDGPCRVAACMTTLAVDSKPVSWSSVELFYPSNEDLAVTLSAGGRTLREGVPAGPDGCRRTFRGSRIVATVTVCGTETPVRIRARRTREGMVAMGIAYQALPYLDG